MSRADRSQIVLQAVAGNTTVGFRLSEMAHNGANWLLLGGGTLRVGFCPQKVKSEPYKFR